MNTTLDHKHISSGEQLRKFGYGGDWNQWADHLAEQLWNAKRDLPTIPRLREERTILQGKPLQDYMVRRQAA